MTLKDDLAALRLTPPKSTLLRRLSVWAVWACALAAILLMASVVSHQHDPLAARANRDMLWKQAVGQCHIVSVAGTCGYNPEFVAYTCSGVDYISYCGHAPDGWHP